MDTSNTASKTPEQQKAEIDRRQFLRDKLSKSTDEMFNNVKSYIQAELLATSEDYKVLHQMNVITRDKYVEMTATTQTLVKGMTNLQARYQSFQPYLEKIDALDDSIDKLEKTVTLLDDYTKRLDAKFQALQKMRKIAYKRPAQQQQQQQQSPQQPQSQELTERNNTPISTDTTTTTTATSTTSTISPVTTTTTTATSTTSAISPVTTTTTTATSTTSTISPVTTTTTTATSTTPTISPDTTTSTSAATTDITVSEKATTASPSGDQ